MAIWIPKQTSEQGILQGIKTFNNDEEVNLSRRHNNSKCLHV